MEVRRSRNVSDMSLSPPHPPRAALLRGCAEGKRPAVQDRRVPPAFGNACTACAPRLYAKTPRPKTLTRRTRRPEDRRPPKTRRPVYPQIRRPPKKALFTYEKGAGQKPWFFAFSSIGRLSFCPASKQCSGDDAERQKRSMNSFVPARQRRAWCA